MDDIAVNKAAIIRRCLARIREEYRGDPSRLENFTVQDSIVLNLLRACEAAIDLAMHEVAKRRAELGPPQSSREAFELLAAGGLVPAGCAAAMKKMVGFRNICVHEYQSIQLSVLRVILEQRLGDFEYYLNALSL